MIQAIQTKILLAILAVVIGVATYVTHANKDTSAEEIHKRQTNEPALTTGPDAIIP